MKTRFVIFALALCFFIVPSTYRQRASAQDDALRHAYDAEPDWNDQQHLIPLNYQQAKGKRLFYQYCVWCHADSTPAGPSNRSNLNPVPVLMNDGAPLNGQSDESLQKIITLGGSAVGKSAMMPPFGRTLTPGEIQALIAFARAIAQPAYHSPVLPRSKSQPGHS
jgi:mono/diheme cytochrome c family protein